MTDVKLGSPPLGLPTSIRFSNVNTQSFTQVEGGRVVEFGANVVARIDGDAAGVFSVTGLESLALERDPELPPGSPPVWTTVATVDGPGPITVRPRMALGVTVACTVPANSPVDTLTATAVAVANGTDGPVLMALPIQATVNLTGDVSIEEVGSTAVGGFLPGETAVMQFVFTSTLRQDVAGTFACTPSAQSPFTSSTVNVFVPGRAGAGSTSTPVTLPVTCAAGAAPGGSTPPSSPLCPTPASGIRASS